MSPVADRQASGVDVQALDVRIDQVRSAMRSHGGAVELLGVDAGGCVELRFTGMCQGCPFRSVTMHSTIEPALLSVPGVTAVHADGARISEFAAERLRAAFPEGMRLPPVAAMRG